MIILRSDISDRRFSCWSTTMSNLQPSTEFAQVGLAHKLTITRDGWKRTAILPALSFAACHAFSALLSSHRREAERMLLRPFTRGKDSCLCRARHELKSLPWVEFVPYPAPMSSVRAGRMRPKMTNSTSSGSGLPVSQRLKVCLLSLNAK